MTEPPSTQPQTRRNWVTDGLLIAAAPTFVYLLAFTYHAGFAGYFRIPLDLVSLNAEAILIVASRLWLVGTFLFAMAASFLLLWPYRAGPVHWRVMVLLPPFLLFMASVLLYERQWREWIGYLLGLCLAAAILFAPPPIGRREAKTYMERLQVSQDIQRHDSLWDNFKRSGGVVVLDVMFILWFGLNVAYQAGRSDALWKSEFLVLPGSPDAAVLAIYGNNLVAAPFDRQTRTLQNSILIIKLADGSQQTLILERVGPLHPAAN